MNQQPKRNRQRSPLLDAYAKENPQSGLLNLLDALEQLDVRAKPNTRLIQNP